LETIFGELLKLIPRYKFDKAVQQYQGDRYAKSYTMWHLLGLSAKIRLLAICHCYRKSDEVVRIITARKATRNEQKRYWER